MSELRISVPDAILKSFIDDIPEALRTEMPAWILSLDPTTLALDEPVIVPPRSRRRREPAADTSTYSPIEHTLYSVQTFGFTHPSHGHFLMVPTKEFKAILLLETKAVAAVIWEIMEQTIGWPDGRESGGRREWVHLTVRYFERADILSRKQAERGLKRALAKGYIERRRSGARGYEYRLRWKGTN